MSAPCSPVQAIVRVRLAPRLPVQAFEQWVRASRPVLDGVLVTGDVDYELRLECRSFADLGDALTRIYGYPGVEVASAGLVLREVTGPAARRRGRQHGCWDEVTMRRQRTM